MNTARACPQFDPGLTRWAPTCTHCGRLACGTRCAGRRVHSTASRQPDDPRVHNYSAEPISRHTPASQAVEHGNSAVPEPEDALATTQRPNNGESTACAPVQAGVAATPVASAAEADVHRPPYAGGVAVEALLQQVVELLRGQATQATAVGGPSPESEHANNGTVPSPSRIVPPPPVPRSGSSASALHALARGGDADSGGGVDTRARSVSASAGRLDMSGSTYAAHQTYRGSFLRRASQMPLGAPHGSRSPSASLSPSASAAAHAAEGAHGRTGGGVWRSFTSATSQPGVARHGPVHTSGHSLRSDDTHDAALVNDVSHHLFGSGSPTQQRSPAPGAASSQHASHETMQRNAAANRRRSPDEGAAGGATEAAEAGAGVCTGSSVAGHADD